MAVHRGGRGPPHQEYALPAHPGVETVQRVQQAASHRCGTICLIFCIAPNMNTTLGGTTYLG